MAGEKPRLYVGCSLTHAPQEFKDGVEVVKKHLAREWEVMHFLGTTAGTEKDVYQVDIRQNVGGCDAFVGIMDEPSWGLGFETREALLLGKPSLLVAHVGSRVTRLALGATHFHPELTFERYEDMVEDVPELVRNTFSYLLESAQEAR